MRRAFLASIVAIGLVFGVAGSGQATLSHWTATVNSSGLWKYHVTNRTTWINPWVAISKGPAGGVKVRLTTCDGYATPLGVERTIPVGGANSMNIEPGTCFRMGLARAKGADTNGILPGKGTTSITGRVEH